MRKYRTAIFTLFAIAFVGLAGRFVYYNIVVPWPYRHELKACLEEARSKATESEIEKAEDICFRTYPHFN